MSSLDDSSKTWPTWATEPVVIVPADATWQVRGEETRRRLEERLRPWLVQGAHHVGSTAIPGLAAKPVFDLMAGVRSLDVASEIAATLKPHGWHFVSPELDQRPWRRFFVEVKGGQRVAHLHLVLPTTPRWNEQLAFRDALRLRPDLVSEYERLKQDLARRFAHDRETYSRGKGDFVCRVLRELDE